jgi:polyhydroxybutyrate depolymerase
MSVRDTTIPDFETDAISPTGRMFPIARKPRLVVALSLCLLGAMSSCSTSAGPSDDSSAAIGSTSTSLAPSDFPAISSSSSPSTTVPSSEYDPYINANPAMAAVGTVTDEWVTTPDGRRRHFRLYVPSGVAVESENVPLLVALHGGLGSSEQFAANSGFDELAEANGFMVVYPDGIRAIPERPGLQTWNGGYCCGPAADRNVDDVAYVRFLLDLLTARFDIDVSRVFAAGHSNGAIMAYRLACELSDRIVAIGVQAGSLGIDDCRPMEPVSVLHIHGLADTNHPIDGGRGTGVSGVEFRSGRDAVREMSMKFDCIADPNDRTMTSNVDVGNLVWSGCEEGSRIELVTVAGASHAWMGHRAAMAGSAALVGEPYMDFDASRAIWSFLNQYSRR